MGDRDATVTRTRVGVLVRLHRFSSPRPRSELMFHREREGESLQDLREDGRSDQREGGQAGSSLQPVATPVSLESGSGNMRG